jgi:hypothetical protein
MTPTANTSPPRAYLVGETLVYAKGRGKQRFEALVTSYRKRGASDQQMVSAMINACGLVSPTRLPGQSTNPRGRS